MIKNCNVFPKNKIGGGIGFLNFPLRQTNSFSSGRKNLKYDYKPAFPKSKKIKKLIDEINSSNKTRIKNNNNNNDINKFYEYQKLFMEEKEKNKNLTDNIILLNNHIDELESQLNSNCQHHHMVNNEIIMLRKENEELRLFKQKVYEFSTKYDEVNKDILLCLKNIEKAVELFNINYLNNNSIEYKNGTLNKISENYSSIINNLTNYLKIKEDEYNTLLMEKENEINKLKSQLNSIDNINKFSEDVKNNIIDYENYNDNINYGNNYHDENADYVNTYRKNELFKSYLTNDINIEKGNEQINLKNTFQNI